MKFIGPQWQTQASGGGSSSGDSCIVVSPTKPADLENGLWIESDLVDKKINILNVEDMTSTSNITMEKLLNIPYYTNGGSIKINNIIYIFGGFDAYYSKSNKIIKYDIITNTYSVCKSTTPEQSQFFIIGRVSNKIYIGCSDSRAIYDISNDTITTFDYTFDSTSIGSNTFFQTINNIIYVVIGYKFFSIDTINNIYTLIDGTTMPSSSYSCGMTSHNNKNKNICIYFFYNYNYKESLSYIYSYDYINNVFSGISKPSDIINGDFEYMRRKFCIDNKYMVSYKISDTNYELVITYKIGKILNNNIINKVVASTYITNTTELVGGSGWYPRDLLGTTHITDDGFMYIHGILLQQVNNNNTKNNYGIFRINYLGKYLQDMNFVNMYSDSIVVMLDKQSIREPHKDDYVPIIKNGNILEYNNIRYCFYINNNSTKLLKVHKIHNYNVIEYKNEYLDEVYTTR